MPTYRDVLIEIWRELGRTLDLQSVTAAVVGIGAQFLPPTVPRVRRFDRQQSTLETVAGAVADAPARIELSPADRLRLVDWAGPGRVLHVPPGKRNGLAALLVPAEWSGEALVGPLTGPGGLGGVLILTTQPPNSFRPQQFELVQALLEPLTAALELDRRMHELAALREAAEADRRTLLVRLGRQEMAEEVVGAERGLRPVMERVELVAQSDVPVLILGETGTGKEVIARAVHARGSRAGGPFIRVNCGAIPSELIDSQLFGHERGSFTGAAETRPGWFERADGGTLFLDEIGELPLPAQVRLLRVLQDGFIERVGGRQPIHVDVRIIAATHRHLATMVQSGSFREDLWYRIHVFPIVLPPLRDRPEDIPELARHFARRAAVRFGLPSVEPTPADLQRLLKYPWPGNIRELGAVIDRAAILGNGARLEIAKALGAGLPPQSSPLSDFQPTLYEVIPEDVRSAPEILTLEAAMQEHIERALTAVQGRIEGRGGAAELLGINPHTLRARMRKLHIDWAGFRRA